MRHTRFELTVLRDRQTGERWHWDDLPMNTPIMLVRSGKRLRFKELRQPTRSKKPRPPQIDNQLSLLEETHHAESTTD